MHLIGGRTFSWASTMEVGEVERLLTLALVPDSEVVREAEAQLKKLVRSAAGCGAVLQVSVSLHRQDSPWVCPVFRSHWVR